MIQRKHGELQSRTFKTEKGDSKTIVEIKARRIQFLNKKLGVEGSLTDEHHEEAPVNFEDDSFEKHLSPEDSALLGGETKQHHGFFLKAIYSYITKGFFFFR